MTRSVLKNQKTFMSMARNWMFNYPCLSKQGRRDETAKFQFERNSKWILELYVNITQIRLESFQNTLVHLQYGLEQCPLSEKV